MALVTMFVRIFFSTNGIFKFFIFQKHAGPDDNEVHALSFWLQLDISESFFMPLLRLEGCRIANPQIWRGMSAVAC